MAEHTLKHVWPFYNIMHERVTLRTENEFNISFGSLMSIKEGGSEFSSYEIELRGRVTQNDVTLRVTNSKVQLLFFYFRVTNSKLKNKKLHFELLTRS